VSGAKRRKLEPMQEKWRDEAALNFSIKEKREAEKNRNRGRNAWGASIESIGARPSNRGIERLPSTDTSQQYCSERSNSYHAVQGGTLPRGKTEKPNTGRVPSKEWKPGEHDRLVIQGMKPKAA
jgi:hypothetical protein